MVLVLIAGAAPAADLDAADLGAAGDVTAPAVSRGMIRDDRIRHLRNESVRYETGRRPVAGAATRRGAPFPGSERENAIRAELVCWSGCQSICTDGLHRCVAGPAGQERCLAATDRCDRICQSDCRRRGGPLIEPVPR
jgi:hypothetical protein